MSKPLPWSPMQCLPSANLSPSGLLQVDNENGEVEVITRESVELRILSPLPLRSSTSSSPHSDQWSERDTSLILTLTTHRFVFFPPNHNNNNNKGVIPCYLPLQSVSKITTSGGGWNMSSPKIALTTNDYGSIILKFESRQDALKDRNDVHTALQRALQRQAWTNNNKPPPKKQQRKVGVGAILSQNKARHAEAKRVSEDAFSSDVEGLMKEARELIRVIHKYAATLEHNQHNTTDNNGEEAADQEKLSEMMRSMGLSSAITKTSAGSMYHTQLARQLADFLLSSKQLEHHGGMMTLTDVYCLFNRARGTNLISPEDILEVVELFPTLNVGIRKRTFPNSGVVVIQLEECYDDVVMGKRMQSLAEGGSGGITAMDTSRRLKMNVMLAMEQLRSAERMGFLCRDVTLEGIRFYPNDFATF